MPSRSLNLYLSKCLLGIATLAVAFCAPVLVGAQDRYFLNGRELSTIFTYTNFTSVAGLTINGNSEQDSPVLLVAPPLTDQIGSVFYTNQVNVAQGFTSLFTLQIIPSSSSYTTADGLAFVIQNSSVNAIGDDTASLDMKVLPTVSQSSLTRSRICNSMTRTTITSAFKVAAQLRIR